MFFFILPIFAASVFGVPIDRQDCQGYLECIEETGFGSNYTSDLHIFRLSDSTVGLHLNFVETCNFDAPCDLSIEHHNILEHVYKNRKAVMGFHFDKEFMECLLSFQENTTSCYSPVASEDNVQTDIDCVMEKAYQSEKCTDKVLPRVEKFMGYVMHGRRVNQKAVRAFGKLNA